MRTRASLEVAVAMLLALVLATGPAAAAVKVQPVHALQASQEIPEEDLLDVGIRTFDPGLPEPGAKTAKQMQKKNLFTDVRRSEARYIPCQLRDTMQSTGFWGAVRVLPSEAQADVMLDGEILESTGKDLVVAIRVHDISGREWLSKRYKAEADPKVYASTDGERRDAFQFLYNRVANDILKTRNEMEAEEVRELRRISELKFAAELAPDVFRQYLSVDRKGRAVVARLPATEDPMMQRVERIRERDYMFVDTLNEYYADFYGQMIEPYDDWRAFAYEEQVAFEKMRREARLRKILGVIAVIGAATAPVDNTAGAAARDAAILAGMYGIQSGIAQSQEAKMHLESLKELAASFDAEVAPLVVEVEGQTLRLEGSAETQFAEWRKILQDLWAIETGAPRDLNAETGLAPVASEVEPAPEG